MLKKYSDCWNIDFPCYSSSSSSSSLVLLWESLSSLSDRAYSSGYRKQYTSSLTFGLRFVISLLPAALLKGLDATAVQYMAHLVSTVILQHLRRWQTLWGWPGREDKEYILQDHYLAGFQHRLHTLVRPRYFHTASSSFHLIFFGFLSVFAYRGFARQPCCIAGTMKIFCIWKNFFSHGKRNLLFLPARTQHIKVAGMFWRVVPLLN